jgi:hypothetical protein
MWLSWRSSAHRLVRPFSTDPALRAAILLCAAGVARVMGIRMGAAPTGSPTGAEDFEQVQIDCKAPSQYIVPNKQLPT